jgi:hypothetical protein
MVRLREKCSKSAEKGTPLVSSMKIAAAYDAQRNPRPHPKNHCFPRSRAFRVTRMTTKRSLRVTKWIGTTPVIALCTACGRQFKVPLTALHRTSEAQQSLKLQFDVHQCKIPSKPEK